MSVTGGDLKKIKKITEELLTGLKVDLTAEVSANTEGVKINLAGNDSAIIIGYHGETLSDFSYILGLLIKKEIKLEERLKVDVAGYLEGKDRKIKEITLKTVEKVKRSGFPEDLSGLNAYERRIAHMVIEKEGLISESTGYGNDRKIVVKPRK